MRSTLVRSSLLASLSLALVLAGGAALDAGCTSSGNAAPGDDGGAFDATSPGNDGSSPASDGSPELDTGVSADAGDSAPSCTQIHLPTGFTQVINSVAVANTLTGAATSRGQAMVLDENDDPMIVYTSLDTTLAWSVNFTRWDACAGAFTTPVVVDAIHQFDGAFDVSIAYDKTTGEIGIAYVKGATANNWTNSYGDVWLATMKAPSTTFALQALATGTTDFLHSGTPSIAMSGGHVDVAFWQGPFDGDNVFPNVIWLLTSAATQTKAPFLPLPIEDGGPVDAGPSGSGNDYDASAGAPAHVFDYTAVPFDGSPGADNHLLPGYVDPVESSGGISLAIDSNGVPAIAAYETDDVVGNKQLLFWRAGTPEAVAVYAFALDGAPDVTLAFDGTAPRLAGHTDAPSETDAAAVGFDSLAYAQSSDGVTWSPIVHLSNDSDGENTDFDSWLAIDGLGNAAIGSDINGSNGTRCGNNPFLATASIGDGGAWNVCGADSTRVHAYDGYSVTAAYGASRSKGVLSMSFLNTESGGGPGGVDKPGVVYWLHP